MRVILLVFALLLAVPGSAQPDQTRVLVAAGLNQPLLLGGANASVTVRRGRLVADYSHGGALDLNASGGIGLSSAEKAQGLGVDVPWTTGFGVGWRVTERLDVRIEPKAHRFEVTTPSGERIDYTAFSAGSGVYYRIPVWRGLEVEPSLRYWPTVASTLSGGEAAVTDRDGAPQTHRAHSFDAFANVSVGWSF